MAKNLPLDNSKWIVNHEEFENLKTIREQSQCLITIYTENSTKNANELIQYGHEANSKIIIQVGGKVNEDFDSRRPFIHLFTDHNNMVKISC